MPTPPGRFSAKRLQFECLEDRTVPTFGASGGLSIAVGDILPEIQGGLLQNEYVTGAGPGSLPYVRVYSTGGTLEAEFLAFDPSFRGGVHVALGSFDGSPYKQIVVGAGVGGSPHVKVFNFSGQQIRSFFAYDASFRGGVNVSAGELNGVIGDEIVTGTGPGGGPQVKVFTPTGTLLRAFNAYDASFRGGVNVAVGNVILNNFTSEIVTGPGVGGSPLLNIFSNTGTMLRSFYAFSYDLRNGLDVATGDTENQIADEIFASQAYSPDANPRVRAFNGQNAPQIESDFNPYPAGYTHYINFAVGDVTAFGITGDFAAVAGEGSTDQTPRILFGVGGSAAGNNGP